MIVRCRTLKKTNSINFLNRNHGVGIFTKFFVSEKLNYNNLHAWMLKITSGLLDLLIFSMIILIIHFKKVVKKKVLIPLRWANTNNRWNINAKSVFFINCESLKMLSKLKHLSALDDNTNNN